MTKKIISIIAAAAVMFTVHAESARLQGLSNSSLIPDPSNVLDGPSYIPSYKDIFQATFTSNDAVEEIFANKSIGDKLSLGFLWNSNHMVSDFYSDVSPSGSFSNLDDLAQKVPHVILGLDLGSVKIGADLFFENATYKYALEQDLVIDSLDDVDYKEKGRVSNPGFLLGAELEIGDMGLLVDGGVSFPNIKLEEWDGGEEENYISRESDKGIFATLGAQLNLELLDMDWSVGAGFDLETHKFIDIAGADSASQATPSTSEKNTYFTLDFLLGVKKELPHDVVLSLEDNFSVNVYTMTPDSMYAEDPEEKEKTLTHNINFGIEKNFKNLKRLDNIGIRFGMNKPIETIIETNDGEGESPDTNVTETFKSQSDRTKYGTDWGEFTAVIGMGIEKGRFAFDTFIRSGNLFNPSEWVFSSVDGPSNVLAGATVTFDFNKKPASSNRAVAPAESYSSPASMSSPEPEVAPIEETSTESDAGSFDF